MMRGNLITLWDTTSRINIIVIPVLTGPHHNIVTAPSVYPVAQNFEVTVVVVE